MYTSYVLCHILSVATEGRLIEVLLEGTYYVLVYSYVNFQPDVEPKISVPC